MIMDIMEMAIMLGQRMKQEGASERFLKAREAFNQNVELRTAKIVACEKVPKAKKLLKLQVDLGYEQRQVVSGIAKFYEPEALIGKKIILVANLKPAVLCGIESNGMILSSTCGENDVRILLADNAIPGARLS